MYNDISVLDDLKGLKGTIVNKGCPRLYIEGHLKLRAYCLFNHEIVLNITALNHKCVLFCTATKKC